MKNIYNIRSKRSVARSLKTGPNISALILI